MKNILLAFCLLTGSFANAQDTTTYGRMVYIPVNIVINIPDVVINQTKFKRTASVFTMVYNQNSQTLSLMWIVKSYADSATTYGTYLGGPKGTNPDYNKEIIADNTVFVDPSTGHFVTPNANGRCAIAYMGQYDFFNMLAETQPLKVHDMIRMYGYQVSNWDK